MPILAQKHLGVADDLGTGSDNTINECLYSIKPQTTLMLPIREILVCTGNFALIVNTVRSHQHPIQDWVTVPDAVIAPYSSPASL